MHFDQLVPTGARRKPERSADYVLRLPQWPGDHLLSKVRRIETVLGSATAIAADVESTTGATSMESTATTFSHANTTFNHPTDAAIMGSADTVIVGSAVTTFVEPTDATDVI